MRAHLVVGAVLCTALAASPGALAQAQALTDPMQREAVAARRLDKAVLLSAASAGARVVAVGERGIVALSDDQGKTWRQAKRVPTSVTLTIVKFVGEKSGWAAGHGGVVLHTGDGGESWVLKLDGLRAAQLMLQHAQAEQQRGAPNAAALLNEAQRLVQDGADKPFFDLEASDERHAVLVGAAGLVFSTADGGASWQPWGGRFDNPRALNLYAIRRIGANLLVAGEQGLVFHSADDGATFARLKSPYDGSWFTAARQGEDRFVVAGLRGNAYRLGADGNVWTRIGGVPPVSFMSAAAATADCTVLANQGGQLFSVTTRQDQARRVDAQPLPPVTTTLQLAGGAWLAFTMNGIFQLGQLKNACSPATSLDSGKP
ncbi:YCF48-related protein [Duganella sp. CF517]|uniref:WD40/YVTN/BNR-like repeat-containing protein n=1 Tax=Duganella sp. CF517 TaxID=1881038 RepID=UPI00116068FC|nr:YCF48-related protein [Duganella sp. CF517]